MYFLCDNLRPKTTASLLRFTIKSCIRHISARRSRAANNLTATLGGGGDGERLGGVVRDGGFLAGLHDCELGRGRRWRGRRRYLGAGIGMIGGIAGLAATAAGAARVWLLNRPPLRR